MVSNSEKKILNGNAIALSCQFRMDIETGQPASQKMEAQCHPLRSSTSTHFFQPLECVRVSVGAGLQAIYPKVGSIPASRTNTFETC